MYGGGVCASMIEGWEGINPEYCNFVPVNTLDNLIGQRFEGQKMFYTCRYRGR